MKRLFPLHAAKAFLVLCLLPLSCAQLSLAPEGEVYYTRFSLFYEKDHHVTTNYRRGNLLPINTPVVFVKSSSEDIWVRVEDSGLVLKIENVEKYSGENIESIFRRMLSRGKVDLSTFTELERRNINHGTIALGMSKDAVLLALGYPPRHRTHTLSLNQWRYWRHRFATYVVYFQEDAVVKVDPPHHLETLP